MMRSHEQAVARLIHQARFVECVSTAGEWEVRDVVHAHVDAVHQEFPFKPQLTRWYTDIFGDVLHGRHCALDVGQ